MKASKKNSTNSINVSNRRTLDILLAIFLACVAIAVIILIASVQKAFNTKAAPAPVSASSSSASASSSKSTTEQPALSPVWHFYNLDLQDNEDKLDDWNFGLNPMADAVVSSEAIAEAIKTGKTTINLNEILTGVKVEELDKNFRERLRKDPVLGAADMAWFDSILGTDYLGVFYSECNEKWDATMNAAAKAWIQDNSDYYKTLDAFEQYLNRATNVELKYVSSGLDDQMYMNPATKSGTPEIIVMETLNHDGWFLVYEFTIKNTTVKEVAYRVDCGYQPTNVAEIMQIEARPNPQKSTPAPSGGGESPKPAPTPEPEPEPEPDPEPPYNKDPTEGTPVLPNDDPGPGPDTNNGVGAEYSTKDLPTNSNHLTPEQYDKAIDELKEANKTTREAGDPNTPTYKPPKTPAAVDNNAGRGTGYGGIDTPTPVQDSSVADDQAGDPWDGPPL